MNKILFTAVAIIVLNLLPLAGKPELLLNLKTIVLVIAAASLWLSQPAFSSNDTKAHKKSDKKSILIILIMSSISVVSSVVEWAYFTDASSVRWLTVLGVLLMITGISIRIWAIKTLGKNFTATATITDNHQFISSGPYKFVRHPSYLGAFLAIVGCPVFLNATLATLIAFLSMTIAYIIRINVEEKMLTSYFCESYERYKRETKMFIPFIW